MIQSDQENTHQDSIPLGAFIHITGWIGRIFLVFTGIWIIYELAFYGVCTYALVIISSVLIGISLLEKLNLLPTNKKFMLHSWNHEKSAVGKSIYYFLIIPFVLVIIGSGLYAGSAFIFAFFQLLFQAPLLLLMGLIATPIIFLTFNWLMDLKSRSK